MTGAAVTIPAALASLAPLRRWCAWRLESTPSGRKAKVPRIAPDQRASTAKPDRWLPLDRARDLATVFEDQCARAGIGLLLGGLPDGRRLVCIDLDACRDPETGAVEPWAAAVLDRFTRALIEVSPSGTGLHLLFTILAEEASEGLPENRRTWRRDTPEGQKAPAIELLVRGYVTVTGNTFSDASSRLQDMPPDALRWLLEDAGPAFAGLLGPEEAKPSASLALPALPAAAGPAPARASSGAVLILRYHEARLKKIVCATSHADFQLLAAHWAIGTIKGCSPGWMRASVPGALLARLPGVSGKRRGGAHEAEAAGRSSATLARARAKLIEAERMAVLAQATRPKEGQRRGVTATFAVVAPMVANPHAMAEQPAIRRMPRDEWRRAVWSMSPPSLRVWAFLLATAPEGEAFLASAAAIGAALGMKRKTVEAALCELVVGGWLQELKAPASGRPGLFCRPSGDSPENQQGGES